MYHKSNSSCSSNQLPASRGWWAFYTVCSLEFRKNKQSKIFMAFWITGLNNMIYRLGLLVYRWWRTTNTTGNHLYNQPFISVDLDCILWYSQGHMRHWITEHFGNSNMFHQKDNEYTDHEKNHLFITFATLSLLFKHYLLFNIEIKG